MDLSEGRAGDDSREGMGEFVAEVVRLGWRRLGAGREEVEASRRGLGVVVVANVGVDAEVDVDVDAGAGWSSAAPIGPAGSRVALGAAAEGLSSIVGAMMFASRGVGGGERRGGGDEMGGKWKRRRRIGGGSLVNLL